MSWVVVVEYITGEHMVFEGEEPETVVSDALDVCETALEVGNATRMVVTCLIE